MLVHDYAEFCMKKKWDFIEVKVYVFYNMNIKLYHIG